MTEEKENQKTFGISKKKRQFNNLLPHSVVAHVVKNLSAMQETQVLSLVQENSLEKGMTTHSSILGKRIPWTEEPAWTTVHGIAKSDYTDTHMCVCVCVCVYTLVT